MRDAIKPKQGSLFFKFSFANSLSSLSFETLATVFDDYERRTVPRNVEPSQKQIHDRFPGAGG